MKKYFYLAAVALMTLTATLSLTSCDDDDDDPYARKFASADFSVYNGFNEDFVKFCDVTWTITDWDGNTTTLKGLAEQNGYEFKTTKAEATATITYTCTVRTGLTPDNAEYYLNADPELGYEVLDQYKAPLEESTLTHIYGSSSGWGSEFAETYFLEQCSDYFSKTVTYTLTLKNNHITCTMQ